MANSNLVNKDKRYQVPQHVIEEISNNLLKNKDVQSSVKEKANNVIKNKFLTYENLKRVKNFFDTIENVGLELESRQRERHRQQNKIDFMIMGGNKMKNWVESQLKELRNPIQRSKKVKSNFAGFKNQFRSEHSKSFVKAPQQQSIKNKILSELKPKKLMENDELDFPMKLRFACICILFNEENKILLLKRSESDDWMAGKFALVGGRCEEHEIPEETMIREIKEETNLSVKKPKLVYSTIEGNTFVYVFIAKTNNSDRIKINDEHTGYVWVNSSEISTHDTVPNIMDMIKRVHEILIANNT
jgi:8-oxo-dGTP pyrophosphatase MutT (NUDIX family)